MTRKEIILTVIVLVMAGLTVSSFMNKGSFDCYQAPFSTSSSCSMSGGMCINLMQKTRFIDALAPSEDKTHQYEVKCQMFGCSIQETSHSHETESQE